MYIYWNGYFILSAGHKYYKKQGLMSLKFQGLEPLKPLHFDQRRHILYAHYIHKTL